MQMTEAFAATVAAVAPVVVLVGVVEMDQRRRIVHESARANGEPFFAVFEDLPARPTPEQIAITRARLEALPLPHGPVGPARGNILVRAYAMGVAWAVVVFALCGAEFLALIWLARPEGKPEAGHAVFCLTSLTVGMFWVVLLPLARLLWAPIQPMLHAEREIKRLEELEEHVDRQAP
ncbi:hypothetical protein LHJ74_11615 [Streptomyces sp. N2-109]|uniref:Integral membrane protein n=1 Tax=Streptomyces gossypii TaxID=2883101 RepID=A0ABT2JRN3_9ACTN|nr:hypothetical protein [Streptomyces gossypii]MCT2590547.1 hypothetical protein [Streptomyces gossypii]